MIEPYSNMDSIKRYIQEKLILRPSKKIVANTTDDLVQLIKERSENDGKSLDMTDVDVSRLDSLSSIFDSCEYVEEIDITDWDTSNATNMSFMFYGCNKLKRVIGLDTIDTHNVKLMNSMFGYCENIREIDLTSFSLESCMSLGWMFSCCRSLEHVIGIPTLDTSKVTIMIGMFKHCISLESVDLSGIDMSLVYSCSSMFQSCSKLREVEGIRDWNTKSLSNASYMFFNCNMLESIDLSGWATSRLENTSYMFSKCDMLSKIDITGWDIRDNGKLKMQQMVSYCKSLREISGISAIKKYKDKYHITGNMVTQSNKDIQDEWYKN